MTLGRPGKRDARCLTASVTGPRHVRGAFPFALDWLCAPLGRRLQIYCGNLERQYPLITVVLACHAEPTDEVNPPGDRDGFMRSVAAARDALLIGRNDLAEVFRVHAR